MRTRVATGPLPHRGGWLWNRTAVALALFLIPALAHAAAVDLYYERAVMSAAGRNCHLFTPDLATALASAEAQARGAALRTGMKTTDLNQIARRAQGAADRTPCASPDIAKAAAKVRTAFEGYSRLQLMTFPGDLSTWTADRAVSRDVMRWKLSQTVPFGAGRLTFGLAGRSGSAGLLAVAALEDEDRSYGARLVIRNIQRAPEPFLNLIRAGSRAAAPLAARLPPRDATISILAQAREPADVSLLPTRRGSGVAFRFPDSAAAALADLDPREAVAVEFLFASPTGAEQVRTAYIEVGDFAAGRAFLSAAQR